MKRKCRLEKIEKIVQNFFSASGVISYYSKPRLHISEKKLFEKYLKKRGKVLDLCCGAGRVAFYLAKKGFDVIGVDNNLKMIKVAKRMKRKFNIKNVKFIYADASEVNFKKIRFDYVLLMENSLEHIASREKREVILKKSYDYLREGGILITSFHSCFYPPKIAFRLFLNNLEHLLRWIFQKEQELSMNDALLFNKKFKKMVFYHFFSHQEIKKLAKKAGFKSFKVIPVNILDQRKNKFKNLKIYRYLKPFLYTYWVMYK